VEGVVVVVMLMVLVLVDEEKAIALTHLVGVQMWWRV
jgi:preprotein translocase subunit SecG